MVASRTDETIILLPDKVVATIGVLHARITERSTIAVSPMFARNSTRSRRRTLGVLARSAAATYGYAHSYFSCLPAGLRS